MANDMKSAARAQTGGELQRVLSAERAGVPFLLWRDADGALAVTTLAPEMWRLSIGRGDDADITLEDPQVSRTHAILERVGEGWTLVDDGLSRNGSHVNGVRVAGRHRLGDGDRIVVGGSELVYRVAVAAIDETVPVEDSAAEVFLSPTQRRVLIALCRPLRESESATPATNRDIAEEVFLSVDAVKAHLRALFIRFELDGLPQNEKRARLAATVLVSGLIAPHEF